MKCINKVSNMIRFIMVNFIVICAKIQKSLDILGVTCCHEASERSFLPYEWEFLQCIAYFLLT